MGQIINASIDLNKIDQSRVVTTDKNGRPFKNGARYLNVTIFVNDNVDEYGNDVGIAMAQTKDERDRKDRKVYVGNGKKYEKQPGNNNHSNHRSQLDI